MDEKLPSYMEILPSHDIRIPRNRWVFHGMSAQGFVERCSCVVEAWRRFFGEGASLHGLLTIGFPKIKPAIKPPISEGCTLGGVGWPTIISCQVSLTKLLLLDLLSRHRCVQFEETKNHLGLKRKVFEGVSPTNKIPMGFFGISLGSLLLFF